MLLLEAMPLTSWSATTTGGGLTQPLRIHLTNTATVVANVSLRDWATDSSSATPQGGAEAGRADALGVEQMIGHNLWGKSHQGRAKGLLSKEQKITQTRTHTHSNTHTQPHTQTHQRNTQTQTHTLLWKKSNKMFLHQHPYVQLLYKQKRTRKLHWCLPR
mmetsp:Transcript_79324/g.174004  ORF Transcript_79324/g.174004 Transcript_79324/m.174004 type:complete len:160 (-) Transcript_79324:1571-2050(-)